MKKLILVLILGMSSTVFAGGDLGGGGSAGPKKSFSLSPQELALLKSQHDLNDAYILWLQKFDQQKQDQLYKDVFEAHILPQIVPPPPAPEGNN